MDIPIIHWYKDINTYIHIHTNTQILYANQYIQKLFFSKLDIFAPSIHYFLLSADWVVLRVIVKALWAALVVLPCTWRQWHLMLLHPHHGKFLVVRMVRLSSISAFQGIHVYVLKFQYSLQDYGFSKKQKIGIPVGGWVALLTN
jgi:hypothetical protein